MKLEKSKRKLLIILLSFIFLFSSACKYGTIAVAAWEDLNPFSGLGNIPQKKDPQPPADDLSMPQEPALGAVEGKGEELTDVWQIDVYYGNAAQFTKPPIKIYANAYEYPSPDGYLIATSQAAIDLSYYLQWVFLIHTGDWIQMETTVPTSSVGVQFWGDTDDGWAKIFVDGEAVWHGNTKGMDEKYPGGAYVYYINISSLENKPHTVRVVNDGEGPTTIYFFGAGKVVP
jgi:hypothetical protein